MNNEKNYISMKLGFMDVLGITFIVLRLCGVIAWNWVLVLAPIWVPLTFAVVAMVCKAIDERHYVDVVCDDDKTDEKTDE